MKTQRKSVIATSAVGLLLLGLAGCAHRPPSAELISARNAYEEARTGPAATLAPDKLYEAKRALEKAERAYSDDPQSAEEKHFAYIAQRVSMIADTYGALAVTQREGMLAAQEHDRLQDSLRLEAESQLASSQQDLATERDARRKAEMNLRNALSSLEEIAQVKEEARGLVITLNGAVLFATNKTELLPTAKSRLDEVATALKELKPGQTITVEGHTDSVGTDEMNMKLSQGRAESVRDYLISRGVQKDVVSAVGKGESAPLAQNTTPDGRANNRRVEIIISHEKKMAPGSM